MRCPHPFPITSFCHQRSWGFFSSTQSAVGVCSSGPAEFLKVCWTFLRVFLRVLLWVFHRFPEGLLFRAVSWGFTWGFLVGFLRVCCQLPEGFGLVSVGSLEGDMALPDWGSLSYIGSWGFVLLSWGFAIISLGFFLRVFLSGLLRVCDAFLRVPFAFLRVSWIFLRFWLLEISWGLVEVSWRLVCWTFLRVG